MITAFIAAWFVRRFTAVEDIERAVQIEAQDTAVLLGQVLTRLEHMEQLMTAGSSSGPATSHEGSGDAVATEVAPSSRATRSGTP